VLLAAASGAIIIGFHVRPTTQARQLAEQESVDIKLYEIIYEAIEDVTNALQGMLSPKITEEVVGTAEVRELFRVPKAGTIAGCYVTEGSVQRNGRVHLIRNNVEIFAGKISSLRRFKEDVSEVNQNFECGIGIDGYNDIKVGDLIEVVKIKEEARTF
jgi:translation initiation factor IF-2